MKRFTVRLLIALLTFIVGVGAVASWLLFLRGARPYASNSQPVAQSVRSDADTPPRSGWEQIFYRYIDKHTDLVSLTKLRSTNLPSEDKEVRVWFGFGLFPLEGFILKSANGQWSAIHLVGDNYYEPTKVREKELRQPRSGWEACWEKLVRAGLRTLPDSSEIDYDVGGPDGWGYGVEVREGGSYRAYHYQVPEYSKREEAKQMLEIGNIIGREFNLPTFAAKKISNR